MATNPIIQRSVTAGLLASTLVVCILFLEPLIVSLALAVFLLIGAWEWTRLAGWQRLSWRAAYVIFTALFALVIYMHIDNTKLLHLLVAGASLFWFVAFVWVISYQRGGPPLPGDKLSASLIGWIVLVPAWTAMLILLTRDTEMLLILFGLIWLADVSAFLVGRRWGQRRLASRVSPGKTWEGLAAALLSAIGAAIVIAFINEYSPATAVIFCIWAFVTVAFSVVGDLVESMFKRERGIKDSGTLLPGHGGVLDRIDSLLAAAPVFTLGVLYVVPRS